MNCRGKADWAARQEKNGAFFKKPHATVTLPPCFQGL
jgi:hypothetical protein